MTTTSVQLAHLPVQVRAAQWEDRHGVLALLRGAEFRAGVPDLLLNRLFTYHWLTPKPNYGYLLEAGGRIVGFGGLVYSHRKLSGREVKICGPTTLYLDPAFRVGGAANPRHVHHAIHMAEAMVSQKGWNFVALSPSPAASAVIRRVGFRCVSKTRLAFLPDRTTLAAALRPRHVHSDPDSVLGSLPEDQRTMACDHLLYGCRCYAIECDGEHSLAITKRTHIPRSAVLGFVPLARARKGSLPASNLLYFANKEAAGARWRELVARILVAERTAAVLVSDWMVPAGAGQARRLPRRVDMLAGEIDPSEIDAAYSEMALF